MKGALPFVGIDDFAFKKRFTYGTIIIDLLTHQPLDILPTRESSDVTAWLKRYPDIKVVSRDGSKSYAKAIKDASPDIKQVGDRWHILKQLFETVKQTIRTFLPKKWVPPQKDELNAEPIKISPRKSDHTRIQNEEKHWNRIKLVHQLKSEGFSIAAISRKVGITRQTVYKDLKTTQKPSHVRESKYQAYQALILNLVKDGLSFKKIEASCREKGYKGSVSTLNTLIAQARRNQKRERPIFLHRRILKIVWDFQKKDHKSQFEQIHPDFLNVFPDILSLDQMVSSFRIIFKNKESSQLLEWMEKYQTNKFPFFQSFIAGLKEDLAAVLNGVQEPWSNGVTEGQVNRLKNIKRLMYGRANFDLLKKRFLYKN
ncbi:ISL3 family transposase [Gracilibacillus sp. Marseille-QA3620]